MRQLYEVHISISINRVLLEHTMLIYTLATETFALQQQNGVVVLQLDNPNIFTTWPFTEKLVDTCSMEKTHMVKKKTKNTLQLMSYEGEKERRTKRFLSCVPITDSNNLLSSHVVGILFAEWGHESVTLVQFHGGLFLPLEGQRVDFKHDEKRRIIVEGQI